MDKLNQPGCSASRLRVSAGDFYALTGPFFPQNVSESETVGLPSRVTYS